MISIEAAAVGLDGSPPPAHGGEADVVGEREALQDVFHYVICEVQLRRRRRLRF